MESLPASLQEQRQQAGDQAQTMLDFCMMGSDLPDGRQKTNVFNIAWAAAREGLWNTFTMYYEGDAEADFIYSKADDKKGWVEQFSAAGDYERAEAIAVSISAKDARADAEFQLAFSAAKAGDVERSERYAAKITKPKIRQSIIDTTFRTLAANGAWDMADELAGRSKLSTEALLTGAGAAAKQGDFEHFVALANRGAKQSPTMQERGDPDRGDWLGEPVTAAARTAFMQGAMGFIAKLPSVIKWPEDAKSHVNDWITSGILDAIYESQDYATGIGIFAAKAIEAGEDKEAYDVLQEALDERSWPLIEIIAPRLNSEVLGLLHRLAYVEGETDAAMAINDTARMKNSYEGNYLVVSDDTAPTMIDEAEKGNWERALDLRFSLRRIWAYDNLRELIKIAVSQERYDLLPEIARGNDGLLESAVYEIDKRAAFDEADKMEAEWLEQNEGIIPAEDLPWVRLGALNHRAPMAAYFGDWQAAAKTLQEMDDIAKKTGDNYGHRGYEFVAIEALKVLKAARSKTVQAPSF